jgi:rod shape determining protein RodA
MQSLLVYLPPLVLITVPFLLIIKQPDLGTALALLLGALSVLFAAGMPWRYIFTAIVLGLGSLPVLWMQLHAYQKERVMTFLNPGADALGAGYQITQSKIALGSGGLFGKGFLMGSQSQLNYLPEKQTDFVFTMIGEEFGLVGNLFILSVYLLLIGSILAISLRVGSRFAQLTCVGIAMMLFLYVFVNVAMVTGLLPVVGAPLPLISYGGTAMLTVFVGLGIVVSAVVHDRSEN